jgi:predicted ATPase
MVTDKNPVKARLLRSITLRNILSFGPETESLKLQNLNVLIGPNASGKSNLLDALSLLRACPRDPQLVTRKGGVGEWIWKGKPNGAASIEVTVSRLGKEPPLRHHFAFLAERQTFRLQNEWIDKVAKGRRTGAVPLYYDLRKGRPVITVGAKRLGVSLSKFDPDLSILAQRKDPERYPAIAHLASSYEGIRLYRNWSFGRDTIVRRPQPSDLPVHPLMENFSNLGLFLGWLRQDARAKAVLLDNLRDLYEDLTDFDISIKGGTVQVIFYEGDFVIPATQLSDGSVRYLCLLAILLDPDPPPLIAVEEPELGLHPDLLPKMADLLVEASQRTQLIVTTHSEILVDALTKHPESLVVCEKHSRCTTMRRLDPDDLKIWLKKYRLGELWSSGELGGNRW